MILSWFLNPEDTNNYVITLCRDNISSSKSYIYLCLLVQCSKAITRMKAVFNKWLVSVLLPAVNMITEPDYLNQKILNYLEAQRAAAAVQNRTHEYARSFEDFLKLIHNCNEIDTLKRIRLVTHNFYLYWFMVKALNLLNSFFRF